MASNQWSVKVDIPVLSAKVRAFKAGAGALARHYRYQLACQDMFSIWGNDDVAIGAGAGCDVAGALPGDKLGVRVFVFSGKDGGEESGQAGLDADLGFQVGMEESERTGGHSGESFEHRSGEEFEGDHGGDWVAGEAEEIFLGG